MEIWKIVEKEEEDIKDVFIQRVFMGLEELRDAGKLKTNRKAGSFQTLKGGFQVPDQRDAGGCDAGC